MKAKAPSALLEQWFEHKTQYLSIGDVSSW